MKQLRILTGQHAGVHLDLTSTRYVIGADDKADIQLLDWVTDTMVLEVGQDDMISIAVMPQDASEPQPDAFVRVEDFAPRRIGDIVLCVGGADQTWPSDIDLIARLTQPVAEVVAPKRLSPRLISVGVGAVLLTGALGAAVAHLSQRSQESGPNGTPVAGSPNRITEPLKLRVERAIAGIHVSGLQVTTSGDGVSVGGLLDETADVQALRQRLATFASEHVVQAYGTVAQVSQSIAESLSQPGLKVSYQGQGVFVVSGQVSDVEHLRESVERVAADLAPLVRRIELGATELPTTGHVPMSALLSSEGLQYVQTRDGVKHLSVSSTTDAEVIDPPAATSR